MIEALETCGGTVTVDDRTQRIALAVDNVWAVLLNPQDVRELRDWFTAWLDKSPGGVGD